MRKPFVFLLAFVVIVAMTACGANENKLIETTESVEEKILQSSRLRIASMTLVLLNLLPVQQNRLNIPSPQKIPTLWNGGFTYSIRHLMRAFGILPRWLNLFSLVTELFRLMWVSLCMSIVLPMNSPPVLLTKVRNCA